MTASRIESLIDELRALDALILETEAVVRSEYRRLGAAPRNHIRDMRMSLARAMRSAASNTGTEYDRVLHENEERAE